MSETDKRLVNLGSLQHGTRGVTSTGGSKAYEGFLVKLGKDGKFDESVLPPGSTEESVKRIVDEAIRESEEKADGKFAPKFVELDDSTDTNEEVELASLAVGNLYSIQEHSSDYDNPHVVTKEQIGLENVDNTSDMDKPVSTATREAIDEVAEKLSYVYRYKGSVATYDDLPETGNEPGDVYNVKSDGMNVAWAYGSNDSNDGYWDDLGPSLQGYLTEEKAAETYLSKEDAGSEYATKSELSSGLAEKANVEDLAAVATTGDYDDLANKPHIPDDPVQADWLEDDSNDLAYIKNKPVIPQPVPQVQADWLEDDSNDLSFIRNKPAIPQPVPQVQSDWLEDDSNDISFIRNKPSIPTTPSDIGAATAAQGDLADTALQPLVPALGSRIVISTQDGGLEESANALGDFILWDQAGRFATIDSPDFTGTPTAPTASVGSNTTQIATTAFVDRSAVRYDKSQSLTDEKKLQARLNIDAIAGSDIAPGFSRLETYAIGDIVWNWQTRKFMKCTAAGTGISAEFDDIVLSEELANRSIVSPDGKTEVLAINGGKAVVRKQVDGFGQAVVSLPDGFSISYQGDTYTTPSGGWSITFIGPYEISGHNYWVPSDTQDPESFDPSQNSVWCLYSSTDSGTPNTMMFHTGPYYYISNWNSRTPTLTLGVGTVTGDDPMLIRYPAEPVVEQLATINQLRVPSDATPLESGVGSAGSSPTYARGDHRHPTDTSRMPATANGNTITTGGTYWDGAPIGLFADSMTETLGHKLDCSAIAEEYDAEHTYHIGDYCTYQENLYECKHETSGDWDSDDWDIVTVTGIIPAVNNGTLTINNNGAQIATFSANSSSNVTLELNDYKLVSENLGSEVSVSGAGVVSVSSTSRPEITGDMVVTYNTGGSVERFPLPNAVFDGPYEFGYPDLMYYVYGVATPPASESDAVAGWYFRVRKSNGGCELGYAGGTVRTTVTGFATATPTMGEWHSSYDPTEVESGTSSTISWSTVSTKTLATTDQIPPEQVQPDWNQTNSSSKDFIKNKPVLGDAASKNVGTGPSDVAAGDHTHSSIVDGDTMVEAVNGGTATITRDLGLGAPYVASGSVTLRGEHTLSAGQRFKGPFTFVDTPGLCVYVLETDPDPTDFNEARVGFFITVYSDPGEGIIGVDSYDDGSMDDFDTETPSSIFWNTPEQVSGSIVIARDRVSAVKTVATTDQIPAPQVQSDWLEDDSNDLSFIRNKPVVDSQLDSTSTNAIQNAAVASALGDIASVLDAINGESL